MCIAKVASESENDVPIDFAMRRCIAVVRHEERTRTRTPDCSNKSRHEQIVLTIPVPGAWYQNRRTLHPLSGPSTPDHRQVVVLFILHEFDTDVSNTQHQP